MVFLPIKVVNNTVMCEKIHTMPWLQNMQDLKLLTLHWRSVSGCSREHVAVDFPSKGCQYLINGCLQPIGTWIAQHWKLKMVDTLLTLVLRMWRWLSRYLFRLWQLQICPLWKTTTKSLGNYRTYKTTHRWHSIDGQLDVLLIQHLLPMIIVFSMIWRDWFSFWPFETWPCSKAERRDILALFTLTQLNMMNLAKRFIAAATQLFINQYSQATSHHSPTIYL